MSSYETIKKGLFCLNPEIAHKITLKALNLAYKLNCLQITPSSNFPITLMGLNFPNRVGLAAGFDKNGEYVDALAALGFGFIEIGTITPKPQFGNPRPRVFRLTQDEAIINRMGFNNKGADHVKYILSTMRYRGILGINLGKNFNTPLNKAVDDYVYGFRVLHRYASYIAINISSPNTPHLRELQDPRWIIPLLEALKHERDSASRYIPLVVKLSPDLTRDEIKNLADILLDEKIDGIIATNTTLSREGVTDKRLIQETGGLSGAPLSARSTEVIQLLHQHLQNKIPIIGSGGVMDINTTQAKFEAGASLIQLYTGLIYRGPRLIKECAEVLYPARGIDTWFLNS